MSMYGGYSRYSYSNQRCWHEPSGPSLSCSNCYRNYADSDCTREGPRRYANRDDLMDTGFWPADWRGHLTVTIYSITGADFTRAICPPQDWSEATHNMTAPSGSSVYVTLTAVSGLGDELGDDNVQLSTTAILSGLIATLCCCCCVSGIVMFIIKQRKQSAQTTVGGYEEQHIYAESYGQQPACGPAAYAQPAYAQPAYQQPYGQQPAYGQESFEPQMLGQPSPMEGQIVMSTAVPTGQALPTSAANPASGYRPGQMLS